MQFSMKYLRLVKVFSIFTSTVMGHRSVTDDTLTTLLGYLQNLVRNK